MMKNQPTHIQKIKFTLGAVCTLSALIIILAISSHPVQAQQDDPTPPETPIKLIFIHHSTGENLLRDDYGALGRNLDANNYFVSDTNYGWGPNAIGDRTDIVNWPEWFGGERSDEALDALYNESGQNSAYTRTLSDPGGENEIILFKSCFPNSNLEGSPNDPATPGEYAYTVGSAKFIYNSLLDYFSSRPDKMFVVLTAPPVTDPTYGDNARAFNTWLMTEWLANYSSGNVFVFDFYNVLSGPNNHHRYIDGAIQYINDTGSNTSYYPSEDDHPSIEGSLKATEEFVPLLNVWYHRWRAAQSGQVIQQPTQQEPTSESHPSTLSGLVTDFETNSGSLSTYPDGNGSNVTCDLDGNTTYSGTNSLKIEYSIVPGGWVDCFYSFTEVLDWSGSDGVSFYVYSANSIQALVVRANVGDPNQATAPFEVVLDVPPEAFGSWTYVYIPWSNFVRSSWADPNTGPMELDLSQISALDFNFWSGESQVENTVWIDDMYLGETDVNQVSETQPAQTQPTHEPVASQPVEESGESEQEQQGGFLRQLCPLTSVLPLAVVFFAWRRRTKISKD
jgi:hypothetical protein